MVNTNRKHLGMTLFLSLYVLVFGLKVVRFLPFSSTVKLLLQLSIYIFLCLLGCWLFRKDITQGFKQIRQHFWKSLLLLVAVYVADIVLTGLGGYLSTSLFSVLGIKNQVLQNDLSILQVIKALPLGLVVLVLGVMGPLVEEFVFRRIFIKWGKQYLPIWLTIALQAILFGCLHIQSLQLSEFINVVPHIITGLVYGVLYYKTDNILYSSGLHIFNNASTFLLLE